MSGKADHFKRLVRVRLWKTGGTTTCRLYSRNESGNTGVFKSGSVSGTGYQNLQIAPPTIVTTSTFPLIFPNPIKSYSWGAMNINCTLADNDRIQGYNYYER